MRNQQRWCYKERQKQQWCKIRNESQREPPRRVSMTTCLLEMKKKIIAHDKTCHERQADVNWGLGAKSVDLNSIFNPLDRRTKIVRLIRSGNDGLSVAQRRNERDCNGRTTTSQIYWKITREKTKNKTKQNEKEWSFHSPTRLKGKRKQNN